jgi:hypothetical protein
MPVLPIACRSNWLRSNTSDTKSTTPRHRDDTKSGDYQSPTLRVPAMLAKLRRPSMQSFRFAPIPLSLASFLGWAQPASAIDLTGYLPFQAQVTCSPDGYSCNGSLALPSGRETVLEYVSVSCNTLPDPVELTLTTTVGGQSIAHYVNIPAAAKNGGFRWRAGGQVVRIYADPGSTIAVGAGFPQNQPTNKCVFELSGEQSPAIT